MATSATECSPLLSGLSPSPTSNNPNTDEESLLSSNLSKDQQPALLLTKTTTATPPAVGERLPYNDYTTIDWLHDLVRDHARLHTNQSHHHHHHQPGLRDRLVLWWDAAQGWIAAFAIGVLTALIAFLVDISVAILSDWKEGHCGSDGSSSPSSWWRDRRSCVGDEKGHENGPRSQWMPWSTDWGTGYAIYVGVALAYGLVAGGVTMLTRAHLPAAAAAAAASQQPEEREDGGVLAETAATMTTMPTSGKRTTPDDGAFTETTTGKMMYMAAGSGIPEIKTILSGFVIPHFLDFKVLVVKAVGATFAVPTGMCLGKEGPFVHISTCVGYLVANWFPKYRDNGRKMREMLSVACSAGLSVAFGAPIGGVLFSYEVSL